MITRGERRLGGPDGIRGLAALFVVVNHIFLLIVAAWVRHGVAAFVLTLALVVPLTIVFARVFAALFENPVRWRRSPSGARRRRLPRPQQAPA